ncbi:collagen alpha-1(III) chain-like [Neopsephotus bourkii]|uniref:collagen alpha-1(III) chain-like n=1 Tax=Neopsephotus bourkii TaxID=309878 RepID=UPI002AA54D95|nr:collagen alpha-1(III) chain-like [Neopsephotus bourkii]
MPPFRAALRRRTARGGGGGERGEAPTHAHSRRLASPHRHGGPRLSAARGVPGSAAGGGGLQRRGGKGVRGAWRGGGLRGVRPRGAGVGGCPGNGRGVRGKGTRSGDRRSGGPGFGSQCGFWGGVGWGGEGEGSHDPAISALGRVCRFERFLQHPPLRAWATLWRGKKADTAPPVPPFPPPGAAAGIPEQRHPPDPPFVRLPAPSAATPQRAASRRPAARDAPVFHTRAIPRSSARRQRGPGFPGRGRGSALPGLPEQLPSTFYRPEKKEKTPNWFGGCSGHRVTRAALSMAPADSLTDIPAATFNGCA